MRKYEVKVSRLLSPTRSANCRLQTVYKLGRFHTNTAIDVLMDEEDDLEQIRGLHGDILALADARLGVVHDLWVQLETRLQEFRKLLDKPQRNDKSRQVLSQGRTSIVATHVRDMRC